MPLTRKRIWIIAYLSVIGLAFCIMLALRAYDKPWVATTKPPSYNFAINQSISYLRTNLESVDPLNRLILDYLQRAYNLDHVFSNEKTPIPPPQELQEAKEFSTFQRIVLPNQSVNTLPLDQADPMSQMMMQAANCDHIPIQPDFGELVVSNIRMGKYYLTHVAFSLQRMQENGCKYFSLQHEQAIRQEVTEGMSALVKDTRTSQDLRYEAIAFLMDIGHRDQIQKTSIDEMTQHQLPNGSWSNDDHTTILALWSLLEYTRPNTPKEPMIRIPIL